MRAKLKPTDIVSTFTPLPGWAAILPNRQASCRQKTTHAKRIKQIRLIKTKIRKAFKLRSYVSHYLQLVLCKLPNQGLRQHIVFQITLIHIFFRIIPKLFK